MPLATCIDCGTYAEGQRCPRCGHRVCDVCRLLGHDCARAITRQLEAEPAAAGPPVSTEDVLRTLDAVRAFLGEPPSPN